MAIRSFRVLFLALCGAAGLRLAPAAAQGLPGALTPLTTPSARATALGGRHAASAPGFEAFFANPACLYGQEPQKSVAELSFALTDFALFDLLFSNANPNEKFRDLVLNGIEISLDIGGPLAIGSLKNNGGWAAFNVSRVHVLWETNDIIRPRVKAGEELFFAGGKAFRFLENGSVTGDLGFVLKPFYRGSFVPKMFLQDIKHITESMMRDYFEGQLGLGTGLGLRLALSPVFSAGLVFHDPVSPVFVSEYRNFQSYLRQQMITAGLMWLPRRLALGAAWHFPAPFWGSFVTDITIAADYNQMLPFLDAFPRYWMLEIGLGLEIRLLEVFYLRAGLYEAQPAFGIGFDFMIFKLDAAFCRRELGATPGAYTTNAATVNVLFRY